MNSGIQFTSSIDVHGIAGLVQGVSYIFLCEGVDRRLISVLRGDPQLPTVEGSSH